MNLDLTFIITAVGALGWLLILREGLQRWSQLGLNKLSSSSEFELGNMSKPLGRIRLVTVEWHKHVYCLAIDMQGAYVQLIDKYPLEKEHKT